MVKLIKKKRFSILCSSSLKILCFDFKRVAILSYGWNNRVKHHIKEAYGSVAMKNDKHNTLFQILSFGIPALLTVITLIARYVDADELLGKNF